MRLFLALGFVCMAAASAAAFADEAPVSTPVAKTNTTIIGQKIEVPKNPVVVVTSMVFAPGARTPVHKHLYPHYAYIQEGTLTVVNTESGKSFDVKAGSFFAEMTDTWHYGINNGKAPVRLLVIDQLPDGVKANVILKDPKEAAGGKRGAPSHSVQ